jgi:Immunity protein 74
MHITWIDPHNIAVQIDGRRLHISGEGLLGDDNGFAIYPAYIRQWDDGTPMSDEVKAATLNQVVHEAATRGWRFEIVW